MTLRLAVAVTDASNRLPVGRLGLTIGSRGAGQDAVWWPHRWHPDGWLVLGPDRVILPPRTPDPPPTPLLDDRARLRLPDEFSALLQLDVQRRLLTVFDGQHVWLLTLGWLAPLLP